MECDGGHYVPLGAGEAHEGLIALPEKKAIGIVAHAPVAGLPLESRPAQFGTLPFRTGILDV